MNLADLIAQSDGSSSGGALLLVLVVLVVLAAGAAQSRRVARTCARHGHVPDAKTIGTWSERCQRCGARIR